MIRPAFLFAALALGLSGCGAPAGALAVAACKVPVTARFIPVCREATSAPEAPASPEAPAAPAPSSGPESPTPARTLAQAAAEKAAASRIDIDFLAGLWIDKGAKCGAAGDAFYIFERNMTFSSPSLESGRFTLKGPMLTLLPEDEFTGKVARREVLDLKRDGDILVMAGTPLKKCARFSRCIEKNLPLVDCNTY